MKILFLPALLIFASASSALAGDTEGLQVRWKADYTALDFFYLGKRYSYPVDIAREKFPPRGRPPVTQFKEEWPVISMRARWTISTAGWPEKYRSDAVDLILMFATSAQLYENIYPDLIRSSRYTYPPEFLKEAADNRYDLGGTLRGQEVDYEVTARGGFGASDYTIKTKIRIGLSADAKTVFYYDEPDYISDYLLSREFLFAGRDEGDEMHFEVIMFCVCKPRKTFKSEALRRVKNTGQYFVDRLYEKLDSPPTEEGIERYFELIKTGPQDVKNLEKEP